MQGRKFETIRIENPDDSSQYVMVHRPTTIYFKHKDSKSSTWDKLSLAAASVDAWQADLDANLGFNTTDTKCKMAMSLLSDDEQTPN
jgi:hypothetical protein